jgi:hypothetical protein
MMLRLPSGFGSVQALVALSKAVPILAAAALFALGVIWLPLTLTLPLGRDQGIFAWVGTVILDGGMPYRDAWEVKGPLVGSIYAVALGLFGPFEWSVRLIDLLIWLAGLGALWRIGGILNLGITFRLLAIAVTVLSARGSYWDLGQPDAWAGLAALGVVAMLLSPRTNAVHYAAAGALVGATVLIKPVYVLFGLAIIAAAFAQPMRLARRGWLIGAGCAGGAAVIGLCIAIFAAKGALKDFIDTYIAFNLTSHFGQRSATFQAVADQLSWSSLLRLTWARVILICAGLWWLHWDAGRRAAPLSIALTSAYVAAIAQAKWYPYHFLPFEILSGLPVVYAVYYVTRPTVILQERMRTFVVLAACIWLCFASWTADRALAVARTVKQTALHTVGRLPASDWDALFCSGDFCHRDIEDVATFVNATVAPGDSIYLWGFDALVYVLAERPSASRFGFNYPMIVGSPGYTERARLQLLGDLIARPPQAIVVQDGDQNNLYEYSSRKYLEGFDALSDFLSKNYTSVFKNSRFEVYRRNDGSKAAARHQ